MTTIWFLPFCFSKVSRLFHIQSTELGAMIRSLVVLTKTDIHLIQRSTKEHLDSVKRHAINLEERISSTSFAHRFSRISCNRETPGG